jgi:uncharacterized membrane protein
MQEKKTIAFRESINIMAILLLLVCGIIASSAYLMHHYFAVVFPTGLATSSLCEISSFFNCDTASYSPLSNIFGIPIALYGILYGIYIVVSFIFKSEEMEGTIYFISLINVIGCIILFAYSLIALGSLCPFCTVYYVLGGIVWFIYFKFSDIRKPSIKILAIFFVTALLPSAIVWKISHNKTVAQSSLATDLIKQYNSLADLGEPSMESPYKINVAYDKFIDAPIRISIFSDFQCPACARLSESIEDVVRKYKKTINIQYFFYPLDPDCNSSVKIPMHPSACKASYLAACLKDDFFEVHNLIFKNYHNLTPGWLHELATKRGVRDCMNDPKTKEKVINIVNAGEEYGLQSTPTMIINGKKIEGALPKNQLFMILDELLKRNGKKD